MKKFVKLCLLSLVLVVLYPSNFVLAGQRVSYLGSNGDVNFSSDSGSSVNIIKSADFFSLANSLDELELKTKQLIVDAVNNLDKNDVLPDVNLLDAFGKYRSYSDLVNEGILQSQKVATEGKVVYMTDTGLLSDSSVDTTQLNISAFTAENLSVGYAGWINGKYIEGNGHDNDYFYNLGYLAGKSDTPNAAIEYIYHEHTGNSTNGGGCYGKAIYHKHTGNSTNGGGCYGKAVTSTKTESSYWVDEHYHGNSYTGVPDKCRRCSKCGKCEKADNHESGCTWTVTYTTYSLNCGSTTSTIEGYNLNCGKVPGVTIEKAIIVFE